MAPEKSNLRPRLDLLRACMSRVYTPVSSRRQPPAWYYQCRRKAFERCQTVKAIMHYTSMNDNRAIRNEDLESLRQSPRLGGKCFQHSSRRFGRTRQRWFSRERKQPVEGARRHGCRSVSRKLAQGHTSDAKPCHVKGIIGSGHGRKASAPLTWFEPSAGANSSTYPMKKRSFAGLFCGKYAWCGPLTNVMAKYSSSTVSKAPEESLLSVGHIHEQASPMHLDYCYRCTKMGSLQNGNRGAGDTAAIRPACVGPTRSVASEQEIQKKAIDFEGGWTYLSSPCVRHSTNPRRGETVTGKGTS